MNAELVYFFLNMSFDRLDARERDGIIEEYLAKDRDGFHGVTMRLMLYRRAVDNGDEVTSKKLKGELEKIGKARGFDPGIELSTKFSTPEKAIVEIARLAYIEDFDSLTLSATDNFAKRLNMMADYLRGGIINAKNEKKENKIPFDKLKADVRKISDNNEFVVYGLTLLDKSGNEVASWKLPLKLYSGEWKVYSREIVLNADKYLDESTLKKISPGKYGTAGEAKAGVK